MLEIGHVLGCWKTIKCRIHRLKTKIQAGPNYRQTCKFEILLHHKRRSTLTLKQILPTRNSYLHSINAYTSMCFYKHEPIEFLIPLKANYQKEPLNYERCNLKYIIYICPKVAISNRQRTQVTLQICILMYKFLIDSSQKMKKTSKRGLTWQQVRVA